MIPPSKNSFDPDTKAAGLFRDILGDGSNSLLQVFESVERESNEWPTLTNPLMEGSCTNVDIVDRQSRFRWHFMRLGGDLLLVTTRADVHEPRIETVKGEGFVEFHYLLEGPVAVGVKAQDDPEISFHSGDLFCCRQTEDVDYTVWSGPGEHLKTSIYVTPAFLTEYTDFPFESAAGQALISPPSGVSTMIETILSADSLMTLRRMINLQVSNRRDLVTLTGLILQLIGESVDSIDAATEKGNPVQDLSPADVRMIAELRSRLHEDLAEHFTLTRLAKELGTNTTKLKSGFRLVNGTTIHKYRTAIRMEHALDLLQRREGSVAAIGRAVGYERQASFSSAFKSYFGVPPKSAHQVRRRGGEFPK
ncbi:helix-turn-helix transcriptional regulator [Lentibacter sp. XHP0401]|uniref:helix-turn-helix transcriptional regulator n=1 Tax=Lentibacter sp. XHP0401 TaxID=2984334 RepID=UPI0021E98557|nr:AraC family transcriptional regulator [Lentibacter sp. XHP0401]MCV2894644.1 AraC family transcriptional regulator [Lentibacter sp. XHP0401]